MLRFQWPPHEVQTGRKLWHTHTSDQAIFLAAGYDVQTVLQESLGGAVDQQLYQVCQDEGRCLITLDLDFANVVGFPPAKTAGIVVIRVPKNPTLFTLEQLIHQLLTAMEKMSVAGKLWIVEIGRIRVHQSNSDG